MTLKDGTVIEERQPHIRGGAHEPLSRDEIEDKFRRNVEFGGWDKARADAFLAVGAEVLRRPARPRAAARLTVHQAAVRSLPHAAAFGPCMGGVPLAVVPSSSRETDSARGILRQSAYGHPEVASRSTGHRDASARTDRSYRHRASPAWARGASCRSNVGALVLHAAPQPPRNPLVGRHAAHHFQRARIPGALVRGMVGLWQTLRTAEFTGRAGRVELDGEQQVPALKHGPDARACRTPQAESRARKMQGHGFRPAAARARQPVR